VEGHTDSTEVKALSLSRRRATSVSKYISGAGIDADPLSSDGFGSDRPIAPGKTAAGLAKNRRVEMKIKNY